MATENSTEEDFDFPPLPGTLGEVLEIVSSDAETQDLERLVQIVERDPAMTAYVIRHANSSFYAVRQHITRVDKAVTFLGFATVSRIAFSAALHQAFTYLEKSTTRNIFGFIMESSLATALLAREFAGLIRLSVTHTMFTGGMLHQLGRLVLLRGREKEYVPLWHESTEKNDLSRPLPPKLEREKEVLGIDYTVIGARTAEKWGFPEELTSLVSHHRDPDKEIKPHFRLFAQIIAAAHRSAELIYTNENLDEQKLLALGNPEKEIFKSLSDSRNVPVDVLSSYLVREAENIKNYTSTMLR